MPLFLHGGFPMYFLLFFFLIASVSIPSIMLLFFVVVVALLHPEKSYKNKPNASEVSLKPLKNTINTFGSLYKFPKLNICIKYPEQCLIKNRI